MKSPHLYFLCLVVFTLIVFGDTKSKNKKCKRDAEDEKKTISGEKLWHYLSSKGPYIYNNQGKNDKYWPTVPYPGCEATKLWYFGRHGTRQPGKKDCTKMQTLLPQLRDKIVTAYDNCQGSISEKQLKKLKKWKIAENVTLDKESTINKRGIKELGEIGSRYKKRFPSLFLSNQSSTIRIRTTNSQRTVASAHAFIQGALDLSTNEIPHILFQKEDPEKDYEKDRILKFYDGCKKWKEEVDDNSEATPELSAFERSIMMNDTITKISKKFGLEKELSLDEVTIIYTTCAFETAWKDGKPSAWCAPFDKRDLEVMSYREDLDYYWKDGFGYNINYEQACTPLEDLSEYFGNETDSETKVNGLFSHSGATLKLLARLGLFEDQSPLKSDNFLQIKDNYKWRTSLIDVMATNLAFVLYDCKPEKEIAFFFQEKPTQLPLCDNKWHCPLKQFQESLYNKTGQCDFNQICNLL